MLKKSKYSIIHHTSVPDKLLVMVDSNKTNYQELQDMKRYWNRNCKLYKKNPNHHFVPFLGMSVIRKDRYFQVTEMINKWNDDKSLFHLVRSITKPNNTKFIEFVELYECLDCGVYCKTRNSYQMPTKLFNRFRGLITRGDFDLTDTPLGLNVTGHFN